MAENKLEFIISKDSSQRDIELDNMSVNAAQAFSVLLTAMINIVQLNNDPQGVKIQIKAGSAVLIAEGSEEQIEEIEQNFNDVIQYKSSNKDLVNGWREVQKLFHANGLEYAANIFKNDHKVSIFHTLKTSKKLRAKPVSYKIKSSIRFLTGKLIAVGGSNPNIHLEEVDGKRLTISCTENNAKKANKFLYEPIMISCWVKTGKDEHKYELCDSYWNKEPFNDFKSFMEDFVGTTNEIEQLKKLHYKCRSYLDVQNYGSFRKFIRLFIHDSTDVNVLKTILIITQAFKDHEKLGGMRNDMKTLFDKQMRIYRKRKENNKW
ncbi:hypothetical protein [Mucilaginibacter sp.]|uniref:hypothetical protein n=1 Tax=Mucilaginibacter sp. TaxID=1882438 RepID=UPI002639A31C|nr:hypothetical protein [Mucilaginibacter sp.]MDB4921214.1 hypothetical protein [Mucilaginibacter sp.]